MTESSDNDPVGPSGPDAATTSGEDTEDLRVVRKRNQRNQLTAEPFVYYPALDGLRAAALVIILFHHARFPFARGGFLALTSFFTLSGFLIMSLVLREWVRDSGIGLRPFWVRRFRRLLPASWTAMTLIVLAGAVGLWNNDQLRALRGDVTSAVLQVVNWHFILLDHTYGADFVAPSPMEHFWSLAVEEQFYLMLPLVVTGILALGATRHPSKAKLRRLTVFFVLVLVASAILNGVLARRSIDRAYFGTDTRMAEILVGVLLAIVMLKRLTLRTKKARITADVLGLLGMVATGFLWVIPSLRAESTYPGVLLVAALITAVIIVAGIQGGIVTRLLSFPPLPWLGKISYGVYLLHWPVFVILSPVRTGLEQVPLFALRIAVTLTMATAMYYLIEKPIRYRKILPGRGFVAYAGISVVSILALLALVTHDLPAPSGVDRALREETPSTTVAPPRLQVLIIGDQASDLMAQLLGSNPNLDVTTQPIPDCGLAIGGWIQVQTGGYELDVARCRNSLDTWTSAISERQPDFILVSTTGRDALPRRFEADDAWALPGDPNFEEHLNAMFLNALERLEVPAEAIGAQVVGVSLPEADFPPPEPVPGRPTNPDPNAEQMELLRDQELESSLPELADADTKSQWRRTTADILHDTAESHGNHYLDIAGQLDALNGATFRLDGDPTLVPSDLGEKLSTWLYDELLSFRGQPAVGSAPPLDINSVVVPDAPPPRQRRHVVAGRRPGVLVAGDSVGVSIALGLGQWGGDNGVDVWNAARLGCPLARGGTTKIQEDTKTFGEGCDWSEDFAAQIAANRPNVVLMVSGLWEISDRRLPGDSKFRHPGDPLMDKFVLSEILSAVDLLGSDGATVVLALQPHVESGRDKGFTGLPESEPSRIDTLNGIYRQVAELRPGVVELIDLVDWLDTQPGGEMNSVSRPDGIHFTSDSSFALAQWLGPQLVAIAEGR